MPDLYETLGVPRDANPSEIKKAHRKQVARLHPDNQETGDVDGFQSAQRAYEILSDPGKRDTYDRTGQTDSAADNRQSHIIAIVVREFTAACSSASLEHDDICAIAVKSLTQTCVGMKRQIAEGREAIADMAKARDRVTRKSGENFIAAAMSAMIADNERGIAGIEDSKAKHEAAIDLLKSFEYKVDQRPAPTMQQYDGRGMRWTDIDAEIVRDMMRSRQQASGKHGIFQGFDFGKEGKG